MRLILIPVIFTYLIGCSSSSSRFIQYNPKRVPSFLEKTLQGDYTQVFKSAQISLANYPIAVSDMESGILKTKFVQNEQMWQAPHQKTPQLSGYRYTLTIQILKVKDSKSVQVTITKDIEHKKDFISEYKKIKTDGLEEITLFYRIQRELLFRQRLDRQHALESKKRL